MSAQTAIPLTRGMVALIDDTDLPLVQDHMWQAYPHNKQWYAQTTIRVQSGERKTVQMHRMILARKIGRELAPTEEGDHWNGNGLDNRRENLRPATNSQNGANRAKGRGTSIYKGVCWFKRGRKWHGQIRHAGRRIHLGFFVDEAAAARAYNEAALRLFGEYARLNVIEGAA